MRNRWDVSCRETLAVSLSRRMRKARDFGPGKTVHHVWNKIRRRAGLLPCVPPNLYVELTDICNLDCAMCDRRGLRRKSGTMAMDLFRSIIDNAAEIGIPAVKLNRFGETLLHPRLEEMIRYAKMKRIPWVYFTSNATLLTEERARMLIHSGLDAITFSFDGATRETYERIRVKASYDEVVENIRTFLRLRREAGSGSPRVVINTIYSRDTQDEIEDVFRLWGPLVERINVIPVGRYGNVQDLSAFRGGDEQRKRKCHHPFDRLMLFWDGVATVCCGDINGELSVGNVRDSRIEILWMSRAFRDIRRKHKNRDFSTLPLCDRCDGTDAVHFKLMQEQRKEVYERAARMGYREAS